MTKEDVIKNLIDGKEQNRIAIDNLNEALCYLALQRNENEEAIECMYNIAYGIKQLEEVCYLLDMLK